MDAKKYNGNDSGGDMRTCRGNNIKQLQHGNTIAKTFNRQCCMYI